MKERIAEIACQLLQDKSSHDSFRIISIGCGDGTFDIKILQEMTERFPDLQIHYIGTDIDGTSCQQAKELLGSLKNVTVETRVEDFQDMDSAKVSKIASCDLVLATHIFYYMRDIKKALSDAFMLLKPDGKINILYDS